MTIAGTLTIDLSAIVANWRALDSLTAPSVETAAVVKADAYGCGAARVAPALARSGVRTFFVALPSEGSALRAEIGAGPVIYVLAGYPANSASGTVADPSEVSLYRACDLRPVLNSLPQATAWFRRHPGGACAVHLNTGMNRLGMDPTELAAILPLPDAVRLVMSHFACADEPGSALTAAQIARFRDLAGPLGRPLSLAATGGIVLGPDAHFDMTRAGVGLYGGLPFAGARSVVALDLPILQIREVPVGATVGYGATWRASRPSRIATLSGGYANGLLRAMGNRAMGYLDGHPAPFVGRVSMDLITLDVTDCREAVLGEMIEILGPHQSIDELAHAAGTVGYEILTSLGSRFHRRYRDA